MGFLCLSRGGPIATEGHIKRWGLYNRWCQIGCQLQHKWPSSIYHQPHVKRPLYRWLDFRRHRKASSLQPTLLPCRRDCTQRSAFMHTCTRRIDGAFTRTVVNIHAHAEAEKRLERDTHTHTLICYAALTWLLLQTHHKWSPGPPLSTQTQPHATC